MQKKSITIGIQAILQTRENIFEIQNTFDKITQENKLYASKPLGKNLMALRKLLSSVSNRALLDTHDLLMSANSLGELKEALYLCTDGSNLGYYKDLLENVIKLSSGETTKTEDDYQKNSIATAKKLLHKHIPTIIPENILNGAKIIVEKDGKKHKVSVFEGYGIDLKDCMAIGDIKNAISAGGIKKNYLVLNSNDRSTVSFDYINNNQTKQQIILNLGKTKTAGEQSLTLVATRLGATNHDQWFFAPNHEQ